MTFREKLADWISGGKLSDCRKERDEAQKAWSDGLKDRRLLYLAINEIWDYTREQKSGTAKKVTRMCREALDS